MTELVALAEEVLAGQQRAVGRAITLVENGHPDAPELLRLIGDRRSGMVLGLTGPPGVGKSTLAARLVAAARADGLTVGAVLVDPSSPFGGGALLGDRYRLAGVSGDPGVFIRSMGSRGRLGGLAAATGRAARLLAASGKDVVLVETVGVGQSELEIAAAADLVLLVLQPGTGDDLQAEKAGVLEVADVIALNKADHPEAAAALRTLRRSLALEPPGRRPPLLSVVAERGEGVAELWAAVRSLYEARADAGQVQTRRSERIAAEIRELALERLRARLEAVLTSAEGAAVLEEVREGVLEAEDAVERILALLGP